MKKILKGCAIVFCVLVLFIYTTLLLFPPEEGYADGMVPTLIFVDVLFAFFLYLLLRKKKSHSDTSGPVRVSSFRKKESRGGTPEPKTISPYLPEIPMETLRDMRKHYSVTQAEGDARIMQESFHLIQQTTDFDTFFSRLELAHKKALTLLQAAQAKCKGVNREKTVRGCEAVLSSVQNAKIVFLDNTYTRETESALQLKTKSGQYKRLEKYLEKLQSNEDQFRDVNEIFTETVSKLQDLMTSIQPADKPSKPHIKPEVAISTADEILKFKQLLDAGAITQAEYEAKKNQLLGL